ncbi:MAG: hypothetical protein ABII26_12775 [Pseudomonadota bacterium]
MFLEIRPRFLFELRGLVFEIVLCLQQPLDLLSTTETSYRRVHRMQLKRGPTDLPVLLLHNLDPTWAAAEIDEAQKGVAALQTAMEMLGHPVKTEAVNDKDLKGRLSNYGPDRYVVFNWCEDVPGFQHSDSLVAHTLEIMNFAYTGSTSDILALSWDKQRVKCLLGQCGVPTPRWRIYRSPELDGWNCYPAIVKPAYEHCSFGVTNESVVMESHELSERITFVLDAFNQPALVEDFIDGREFHVSLWGNGVIEMLPPAEMDFAAFGDVRDRLCTFDSKFRPGSRHYEQIELRLPAPLNESEFKRLKLTALKAYRAIGCRDYARLDIRLQDSIFYVLDVNPNPDISPDASIAYAAEAAGYSYGAMGSHLVNLASQRHPVFKA